MTMRLDIVTNDAGEGVRREHARELGAGVVIAVYRLAKLAQVHDLTNQAFVRQLEQTHQIIGDYCLRSGSNVSVLFAHKAVFVAGQLLKGSRFTYDAASELGELFERIGGSELSIQRDLTREELLAFSEQISRVYRGLSYIPPTPKIRLRPVNDAARLRGLELEVLTEDQRIIRMYASAVVIMRRFYEDLQASRYILPRRIKRIAQSLVDLGGGSNPAFLGVTEVRNANFDEAGRAVNTAILAVSMAREVTHDRAILSQIAMAAMMHDVARPRAMALSQAGGPTMPGMAGPSTLSEDQEDRLAAGSAAVLTALGRVNEPSITRTVLAFEALWIRRQTWLGPVYWGARSATLHARLIAVSRRYNDLLTPEPGLLPKTPDYAVAALSEELTDPHDRTVLRMLVSALGLLPMGTVVQLTTGEVAEVVRGPKGLGEKARVRIVMDHNGQQLQPFDVELSQDPRRQVARIMSVDGWKKGLDLQQEAQGEAYGDERESPPPPVPAAPPPPALPPISPFSPVAIAPPGGTPHAQATSRSIADQYADRFASWSEEEKPHGPTPAGRETSSIQSAEHNSSASLPSMGSSPSAVAESMGRMINESLRPPTVGSREVERTLLHQSGEEGEGRATNRPKPAREPTARGNLAATPLPHVLVYMLDHSLSGSVLFEGTHGEDAIYFVGGVPAKVRLQDHVALLGQILVHGGAIETTAVEQAVEGSRRLGVLLGEYLVGHDLVSRAALSWALEAQLLDKIAYLANLAPEISYAYYRDIDLLEAWGGGDVPVGCALNPILASVRNWRDRARVRATLNRVGKHPLVLDDDAALEKLALIPEEEATLAMIRADSIPLAALFKRNVADEEIVSSLVYSLAVTRQFAFKGQKKGPMGARAGSQWKGPSPSAGPASSSGSMAVDLGSVSPSSPRQSPSTRVPAALAPPVSVRKPGQAAGPPAPSTAPSISRGMPPAARPSGSGSGLPRASPPQIRPKTAKKATIVGIQRGATASQRRASVNVEAASDVAPVTPADGMKTIARPAPGRASAPRGAAPPALGAAFGSRPPLSARPDPALPSRLAVAPPSPSPLSSKAPPRRPSTGRSGLAQTMSSAPSHTPPPASVVPGKTDRTGEIEIDLDEGNASRAGLAIEFGDDAVADAEAALEAMQHFRSAEAAIQRNDVASARLLAKKAVDGDPTQSDYLVLLAWTLAHGGDAQATVRAIREISNVLQDEPSNERGLLYRGRLYARMNHFEEAVADFDELLTTNPQNREAQAELRAIKSKI